MPLVRGMPPPVRDMYGQPFHDSALSRFLLRRALLAPTTVGHKLFWLLRSSASGANCSSRYGVLLSLYLRNCGAHRVALGHQVGGGEVTLLV